MSERSFTFDKMYESISDIDENLLDALALLHSTEQDSAEKLRRMLDACVKRKHGGALEKTLAIKMPKRLSQSMNESALPMQTSKRYDITQQHSCSVIKTEIWNDDPEIISLFKIDEPENIGNYQTSDVKVLKVDYEDCCEDEKDIPRISIPDQGYADETVCKIFFN